MANNSMIRPLWTKKDVKRFYDHFALAAEQKIFILLQRTGEEFVKIARESGLYKDWTGNLRSSIGYVIVKDGNIVDKNFRLSEKEGTDKRTGKAKAEQLASDLAKTYKKGWILIGLVGMKYAAYVEAMESKDVITNAAIQTESFVKRESRNLFKRISA